ncbi:MAG: hypothetical protein IH899_11835 [Planctomycetes bacterium]|nr:hypothetical protein [Planctomycetota bacterium]
MVEDEYDREILAVELADEPTDLLYVTYDPEIVTVEKMLETIGEQEFQGELR